MDMWYMMAFVKIPVNPSSHCNSGGPPPPGSPKAIDIYPIFNDRRPGYDIISVPYPGLIILMKITGITYFWLKSTI